MAGIGSSYGGNNYLQSGPLPSSQYALTVNNLPDDGSTVYATWWYDVGGSWSYIEYQYTAAGAGVITSPTNGSTLTGSSEQFTWLAGSGTQFWLTAGNSQGGNNYYNSGNLGNVLTTTVTGLPTDGSQVYVTLFSYVAGQWVNNQDTYTAYNLQSALGVMTTPSQNGVEIDGAQFTFAWSAGSVNAQAYWLDIGSAPGGNNIYQSGLLHILMTTVTDLPNNGTEIAVTLWTEINGQWYYNQYGYQSATEPREGALVRTSGRCFRSSSQSANRREAMIYGARTSVRASFFCSNRAPHSRGHRHHRRRVAILLLSGEKSLSPIVRLRPRMDEHAE